TEDEGSFMSKDHKSQRMTYIPQSGYSCKATCPQCDDENEFYLLTKSLGFHNETVPSSTFSITDCFNWSHEPPLTLIKTWCKQLRHVSHRHDSFPKDLFPGMDQWEIPRLVELPERYCR
ncbi:Hypothetical predicted protein, partial [Paramuricea clavata]